MAQISVNELTFCYEGSFDNIFENVSFSIDTNWKIGFIGRNGKGKTTFLNLLLGKYEYQGSISTTTFFDYFPYKLSDEQLNKEAAMFIEDLKPGCELWKVLCEMNQLQIDAEVLYRPFKTLSNGERTKVMLAVLFSGENDFLLIDEPTNHLDMESREVVKEYLKSKKGFILVSHDRDLLDACVDHVLVLNRSSIEVQKGNFSSWWENKNKKDVFAMTENSKHLKEINKLKVAAKQTDRWADKNESSKIGFDPSKEHDRSISTRSYIGAKTKKMEKRVKQIENRISREIEEKEGLLQDLEKKIDLKIIPLQHYKSKLVYLKDYGIKYKDSEKVLFEKLNFEINQGDRIALNGKNGSGKSSLIKSILAKVGKFSDEMSINKIDIEKLSERKLSENELSSDKLKVDNTNEFNIEESGTLNLASGLLISYINQDTSFLNGSISDFCKNRQLDESLLCAILRQLDMERVQFMKKMEDFSEGQKKKVLIAASLLTSAHLYIWDEPLNYIDVFSRMQIENLILAYKPTMLFVEHDVMFKEKIATGVVEM